MEIILPTLTAILGLFGGLLIPSVRDLVRFRKERRIARRNMIKDLRRTIFELDLQEPQVMKAFTTSPEYSALRQYMQAAAIERVEKDRVIYVGGGRGDDVRKHVLLDEVSRLESEWRLL